jgi:biotin carboxylase
VGAAHNTPSVLLVAQPYSYRIAPYVSAATKLGINIIIASQSENSLISEVKQGIYVDFSHPQQAVEIIRIELKEKAIAAVIGCDDSTVELAALVAARLNLPHNPPLAAKFSSRKDLARSRLQEAGCRVPEFALINLSHPVLRQCQQLNFPCVVKPLHLSASQGVIRVDSLEQLTPVCERIRGIIQESSDLFLRTHVLIERYLPGVEIAFEGYLLQGALTVLAIFDKPDPLEGPFFEETIYVTPTRLTPLQQRQVFTSVQEACHAYGLITGPVHAELRVNPEGAWILEIAARTIGGECSQVFSLDGGIELEQMVINLAMGRDFKVPVLETARGVMMIPIPKKGLLRRVEGVFAASQVLGIEKVDIIIREGNYLVPLPEGNSYLGYLFAQGDTSQAVVAALQEAFSYLRVVTAPTFSLVAE